MASDRHLQTAPEPYDHWGGKTREEVLDLFGDTTTVWRCPDCGMNLTGRTINLDEGRKKCSKTWHKHGPVKVTYVRRDKILDHLLESIKTGDAAKTVLERVAARGLELDA